MSNQLLSERMRELLPTREDWNDVVAEIAALEADLMGLRDALSLAEDRLFHTEQERDRYEAALRYIVARRYTGASFVASEVLAGSDNYHYPPSEG